MSIERVKYNQSQESTVVLPPECKQPEFTGMVDHGAIGVFDNFVKWEFCDAIIDSFEFWYGKKHVEDVKVTEVAGKELTLSPKGDGGKQFPQGGLGRKDQQLYLEICDPALAMEINQAVGGAFELYAKKWKGILDSADPVSSWTCKIQKTNSGGGYHIWHSENGSFLYRDRVLTWMIYLNDVPMECGGATDFFHQEISFQPKKGTVVLWPAAYTHVHRGAFLTGNTSKYIATGWFSREPGDVTNRILGEKMGKLQPKDQLNG
tara:strand:+ start:80 stop:865 length:786 start_codon:yes stop_codon:yes gene_type:complete